jgi:hypothetical protein
MRLTASERNFKNSESIGMELLPRKSIKAQQPSTAICKLKKKHGGEVLVLKKNHTSRVS